MVTDLLSVIIVAVLIIYCKPAGCYDYNPQQADGTINFEACPEENTIYSVGMSKNNREKEGATFEAPARPYDQGIVFMDTARDGPFFQYNYIENVVTDSEDNAWQSMSYSGRGGTSGSSNFCGCEVCPGKTCNLARAGPYNGALTPDGGNEGNMAYNAPLEVCVSGNGNCLSMNGDSCCVGTYSYEYNPPEPCASVCASYWSGISAERPLSDLWSEVQESLPKF